MKFQSFYQYSNRILIRNILSNSNIYNKFFSFTVFILRLLTLGSYFNIGDSHKDLVFKKKSKKGFVLDLRDAKLNLHLVGILTQFFVDIKKKYQNFFIIVNENSFSLNPSKMYDQEFNSLLENLKKIVKFKLVRNTKYFNFRNFSYIKISKKRGYKLDKKDFNESSNIKKVFNDFFKLKSKPINFKLFKSKNKDVKILSKFLRKNFILIFYPTSDVDMKFEIFKRRFGVIKKKNFVLIKRIFNDILKEIKQRNLNDFKIVLLNKKSLNWPENKNIIDLRNFEKYGLNFAEMLGLLNNTCNWTFGSEGTLQYYLLLTSNLKHVVVIDNSHWKNKNAYGSAIPQFYDGSGIKYKNMPKDFVPVSRKQVLEKIFDDYKKYINEKKN